MTTKPPHPATTRQRPPRWVLLRHDTPDGAWHADLMLERPDTADERRLITFRLDAIPDFRSSCRLHALRLGDHRAAYLDYQGELSDRRGRVRRLAGGDVLELTHDADHVAATVRLADASACVVRARAGGAPRWVLVLEPAEAAGPA